MRLAIVQIVLGALILVELVEVVLAFPVSVLVIPVLGLAVLSCGIAQYLKSRRALTEKELVESY